MSTNNITFSDVVNKAREIRRRILYEASIGVVQRVLRTLNETISGKIREAPLRIVVDRTLSSHLSAPLPYFGIVDATTGELYADVGVRSPAYTACVVDPDAMLETYVKGRILAQAKRKRLYAYMRQGSSEAVYVSEPDQVAVFETLVPTDEFVQFNYPSDHPPKVVNDCYSIYVSGVVHSFKLYHGQGVNAEVYMCHCVYLAYRDENDNLVGSSGLYLVAYNYDSKNDLHVKIPNVLETLVPANMFQEQYIADQWTALARGSIS